MGRASDGPRFFHSTYDIWRTERGGEDSETLQIGRWLGFMLWWNDHYSQAAGLDDRLVEIYVRVLGEYHGGVIAARTGGVVDMRVRGDFESALEQSMNLHATAVRAMGSDDPITLCAARDLGVSLRLAGRFAEELEFDEMTWRQTIEICGSAHVQRIVEICVALDLRELGDYIGARTRHEEIVMRFTQLCGARHPFALRATRLHAEMRRKAGDHVGAFEAAERAVTRVDR